MIGRTNTSGGGGSGGLNFQVIGSTAAPSNPKENTIWVDTDTEITSWIFSATEPETPSEGMVWIATGTASIVAFNTLKKNGVMVYPLSSKQCIGGAWIDKVTKSHQDGAWVDWAVFFYSAGNTFDDVTGGYFSNKVNTQYGTGSVTFEVDKITLLCDGSAQALVRTKNKVDLSGISTLYLEAFVNVTSAYDNHGYLSFCATENAITDISQDAGGGATIEKDYAPGINEKATVSLDVSGITDSKYIVVALKTDKRVVNAFCDILEIRGE